MNSLCFLFYQYVVFILERPQIANAYIFGVRGSCIFLKSSQHLLASCQEYLGWLYSNVRLVVQALGTITWYYTQSHYTSIQQSGPSPILAIPSAWLASDNCQFYTSLGWPEMGLKPPIFNWEPSALPIRPPHQVPSVQISVEELLDQQWGRYFSDNLLILSKWVSILRWNQ